MAATQSYKEERDGNNNKRQQFRNSWQRTHICFPLNTFIISVAHKREDENSSRQNFQRSMAYFFRNIVTMTAVGCGGVGDFHIGVGGLLLLENDFPETVNPPF